MPQGPGLGKGRLAARPEALFLDEPFAFLDAAWTASVGTLLTEALDAGTALFMTSHQTPATLAPRISVVHVGEAPGPLVLEAPPHTHPTLPGPAAGPGADCARRAGESP